MAEQIDFLEWGQGHGRRFTHDWFRFPGKFHPPLVEHVLRSIDPRGVVDIMAGVGTVAVEAKAAGIPSLSLDIDPLSVFFARVKTSPISTRTLRGAWKHLSSSFDRFRRDEEEILKRRFRDIRWDAMHKDLEQFEASSLKRLTYWFRRYVLVDYSRIDHLIFNGGLPSRSDLVRRFFTACLLSCVRRISFADPSPVSGLEITGHMRKRISDGYPIDVYGEFERRVELAINRMGDYVDYLQVNRTLATPAEVLQADCGDLLSLKLPAGFKPNLVLFSPPYCNAIEYWRRHRLEYFLGRFLDEQSVIELHRKSIGRRTLGGTAAKTPRTGFVPLDRLLSALRAGDRQDKARLLWQYFDAMKSRLDLVRRFLPRKGYCVIVVGDSTTQGLRVPTAKALTWLGTSAGFEHVQTCRYKIKNRVMQFPVKQDSKIEEESIIVLRRP